ncbi:organic hydroperoxide resistance protein [Marinomonas sp. 42_23_T18]|nr:organic hydroperoxide resistance protein [Marinomonas sp. 42_23_T18]
MKLEKAVYTAYASATGGREGQAQSDDGKLDVLLSTPKELGGAGGEGTNPEQMFAAGYSACFLGALKYVAGIEKVAIPEETKVSASVGIGSIPTGFGIEASISVSMPGLDKDTATALVEKAHVVCPYSNATRGNINVDVSVA